MVLEYLSVNSKNIKDILNSDTFKDFKKEQECNMNLEEINYEIKDGFAIDEDGYKTPETKAQMVFDDLLGKEKIVFYVGSFIDWINRKFEGKLVDVPQNIKILDKICNTIINLALVHELIHNNQVKEGTLSKEIIDSYKNTRYEDRPYEIEAMNLSSTIISRYGEFESEVVKIVNSNELVSNQQIDMLIELYQK